MSEGQRVELSSNEPSGNITIPNYPSNYPNLFFFQVIVLWSHYSLSISLAVDFEMHITAPKHSRILVSFHFIDIEYQEDCLYDFVLLKTKVPSLLFANPAQILSWNIAQDSDSGLRLCGDEVPEEWASSANEALLQFRSDYAISAGGFSASWSLVNISDCHVPQPPLLSHPRGGVGSCDWADGAGGEGRVAGEPHERQLPRALPQQPRLRQSPRRPARFPSPRRRRRRWW